MKRISALLVVSAVAVGVFGATTSIIQSAEAFTEPSTLHREPKAPMAASQDGNNIYIVW
jgi:hypothetical protein